MLQFCIKFAAFDRLWLNNLSNTLTYSHDLFIQIAILLRSPKNLASFRFYEAP